MKKALKIILTTALVSFPLSFLIIKTQAGGIFGFALAFGWPVIVFSFSFVFYNIYNEFVKNYVYPIGIILCTGAIAFIAGLIYDSLRYGAGSAGSALAFVVWSFAIIPIIPFSLTGSLLGRLFKSKWSKHTKTT